MRQCLLILLMVSLLTCNPGDYLYEHKTAAQQEQIQKTHKVAQIAVDSNGLLDVLWVIDNSGSMMDYQQEVIANTETFINLFTQQTRLKWKMGLISTSEYEDPFVGFTPQTALDHKTRDPVMVFQDAVGQLGIDGDATEKTFKPIVNALTEYPQFLRQGATLAILMVVDAHEQSSMSWATMKNHLIQFKGSLDQVAAYGVFSAKDLGCVSSDSTWYYKRSVYESMITETKGKVYPICDPDFGKNLAEIGKDVLQRVTSPKIYLNDRPVISTLKVIYRGSELPGGPKAGGGFWIYDFEVNAIVFHDLNFAPGDNEEVTVQFTKAITN